MWLITWKDFITLGLILSKLSNFKCIYYCQSKMFELDEEKEFHATGNCEFLNL